MIKPHHIEQFIEKSFVDEYIQKSFSSNLEVKIGNNSLLLHMMAKFPAQLLDEAHAQLMLQSSLISINEILAEFTPFESIMRQLGSELAQDNITDLAKEAIMRALPKNPHLTDEIIREIIQECGLQHAERFFPFVSSIKSVSYMRELYALNTYHHGGICFGLIKNPHLPEDLLVDIAKEYPHLLDVVIERITSPELIHSNVAKEIALNIDFQGGYVDILRYVAQKLSNKTPFSDVMLKLLKETKLAYLGLIKNPHTPIDIELKLAKMKSETTLIELAKWTTHEEVMRALLNKSYEVCFALSCNPFVPPFILEQIIDGDGLSLCESIAQHHNIDENVVIHLERMQSDIINRVLNSNPSYIALDDKNLYLEDL